MVHVGLLLRLEAKPGKKEEVAEFLAASLPLIQAEQGTTAWFGFRLGPASFGIFDAFPGEAGRQAHLTGAVADILRATWSDLLASPPTVERVDIVAAKLPI
jgi:quinol monooxygenase YgiN